jgi:hypothetical protein
MCIDIKPLKEKAWPSNRDPFVSVSDVSAIISVRFSFQAPPLLRVSALVSPPAAAF